MPRTPNYDRNDLINKARDLFWKYGWAGTSMKDLEAELKLKPGSFYAAFGSKEALFALAIERYSADGAERLSRLSEELGPMGALQRFPVLLMEHTDAPSRACMLSKTLLELQAQGSALAEKANAKLINMENQFAELFQQAQAMGEIDQAHHPAKLAAKYQSDLLGLRISAEREGVDAIPIAKSLAESLEAYR